MKFRVIGLLVLVLAVSAMAYNWGYESVNRWDLPPDLIKDPVIIPPWGTDDPQPDTIFYHDNIGGYVLNGPVNMWSDTRFTPADEFELRAAYIRVVNTNNNAGRGNVYVLQNATSGMPTTTILTQGAMPAPPPSNTWIYIAFPDSITFGALQDFHIAYGPAPAGPFPSGTGWWPSLDGSLSGPRQYSAFNSVQLPAGWSAQSYGDYMIMAGGEYLNAFTDLQSKNAFVSNKLYWNLPGTIFTFKATVKNVGMTNVTTYAGHWEVYLNSVSVWSCDGAFGPINEAQTVSVTAPNTWTANQVGMYTAKFIVDAPEDENTSNDTTWMELYVTDLNDMPYTYLHEALYGNTSIDQWGVSFNLPETPAKLDSFRIYVNEADTATVSIMLNDGVGGIPSTIVWETITPVAVGNNTFHPQNLVIFDDKFTISILTDSPLSTAPAGINSAVNDSMMTSAWTVNQGWVKLDAGDWPFTAYLDTSNMLPPEPIFAVNDSSINFGVVSIGYPQTFELWIYNLGGEDDLILTNMLLYSPIGYTLQGFVPNTHVPAGDSTSVTITFNPTAAQVYNNQLAIMHNAAAIPFIIPVTGEGTLGVGNQSNELLTFKLGQNEPNPFNPITTIDYSVPQNSHVELVVFNTLGNEVARLVDGYISAGQHRAMFDGSALSSGVYFYRLTAGNSAEMRKMVLMK